MGGFMVLILAVAGIMVHAEEDLEALQADDECSASGSGDCALEALQRQAETLNQSGDDKLSCFDTTGGTCNFAKCNAERHAVCERSWMMYYCNCPKGSCANVEGHCHPGKTSRLLGTFVMRNAEHQNRHMAFGTVENGVFAGKGATPKGGEGWIKLHRMTYSSTGQPEFMISSRQYEGYVVYAGDVQKCKKKQHTKDGESDEKCKIKDGVNSHHVQSAPTTEELFFIKPAYHDPRAIMIESVNIPGCYLTMVHNKKHESYDPNMKVECTKGGHPDSTSFWYPDPPLPRNMFAR
eukprot:TRINITY_DN63226_c0_g1_i1.p1 TRINITY_DN63226_c0_g1~~TRINITY_DN63226_c0_g1_i1.p1  ORF type:complete len:320 (-),score=58.26 TRINITY_DN63226_c0_g1_i1:57-935(-)